MNYIFLRPSLWTSSNTFYLLIFFSMEPQSVCAEEEKKNMKQQLIQPNQEFL